MSVKRIGFILSILIAFLSVKSQTVIVNGTIKDENGKPIKSASLYLLNTNFSAYSDSAGHFHFPNLPPGRFTLMASAIGHSTISQSFSIPKTPADIQLILELPAFSKQLDAVVVTAEKKEENMQHVPAGVSVLTTRQIEDYRIWNARDLTGIIPNLYAANPGDGRNVVSIRGLTSTSYDPAVTTYIDGLNQFTLDTYIPQLWDVERIEVLRGPQGTLYGRNAMGGVINIITRQPSNKPELFASASLGNANLRRVTAGSRLPIIKDKLFLGVAALAESTSGFYTNQFNGKKFDRQESYAGNIYLKYLAGNNWTHILNFKLVDNFNDGSFPLNANAKQAFANPFHLNQNAVAKLVDHVLNSSLSIVHHSEKFNFSSQTAYQSNYRYYDKPLDADFSPIDGITIINNYGRKWNNVKVWTQEFRFTSPAQSISKFKWTAGTYFFYQDVPNKQATHFGKDAKMVGSRDSNYAIINTTRAKNAGAAFYGQGTYSITRRMDLIFGVRYDYQHSRQEVNGAYQPDASPVPVFETRSDTSAAASYSAVSPMASVDYHLTGSNRFYFTYSRGYRTGGMTPISPDPSQPPLFPYKPEYSDNFEAGNKNTFFNNRLLANIAIFYTRVSNAQVPTLVLPAAVTITKNAGMLSSKGFELETSARLWKGFEGNYQFGYTSAKYTRLKLAQNGSTVDLNGNHQVFTPDITSFLALQYGKALDKHSRVRLVVRGEWMYLGEQFFDLANHIRQSPYHLLNTKLGLEMQHYELSFWTRNLTDTRYIAYAYDFGAVHLGNPKTYGGTLKVSF